jgi:hypothetical protein
VRSPQGISDTKSHSEAKSKSQQVLSSSSESEFENPTPINIHDDNDEDDVECIFLGGLLSQDKSEERWVQRTQCKQWGDSDCVGDSENVHFTCDMCLNG